MAIITVQPGFATSTPDFHAFYGFGHIPFTLPGQTFGTAAFSLDLGGVTVEVPAQELVVQDISGVRTLGDDLLLMGGSGLNPSGSGYPTGGTITMLQMGAFGATPDFRAIGISVSGAAFGAAAWTAATADDLALYRQMLMGADLVYLSAADDVFDAGGGKDLVLDLAGANAIAAGVGDDVTRTGMGNDSVSGGRGDDVLIDDGGANHLNGGGGGDIIGTGAGQDTLTGGAGGDVFVFSAGRDVVTDFAVGHDLVLLISSALTMADLTVVQAGGNTRITVDDITVILRNVDAATLTAADFGFNDLSRLEGALTGFFAGWDVIT